MCATKSEEGLFRARKRTNKGTGQGKSRRAEEAISEESIIIHTN